MSLMPASLLTQHEKIPTTVMPHINDVTKAVANEIADLIRAKAAENAPCVLGLATGSTPIRVYAELVRLHKEEGLSFKNVITFNLDEYYPMPPEELQSYHHFMHAHLFNHIDIDPANVNIPNGTLPLDEVPDYCQAYEAKIESLGGLDLQILGIGRTGHIGFNEPGSTRSSRTRLITLDSKTRTDAASDFYGEENVPRRAITMGVGTILDARRIVLLAFGMGKSGCVASAIEGPVTANIAASFLQDHPNAQMMLDEAAASQLTRTQNPWMLGPIEWDQALIKRATIWLAQQINKPILKLTDEDYNEHDLQDLLAEYGPSHNINLEVYRSLHHTITGWPGGKPAQAKKPGDVDRPTDDIFPKRVLIFSPHPDDDVISMGGTLLRLVDHGHEVHVAYQTSGNIAVFDEDAIRFVDFARDFNTIFNLSPDEATQIDEQIQQSLRRKKPGQVDTPEVQQLKGLIRRGEARAAGLACNIPTEQLHFMDMPFYETGQVTKKPLGQEDIDITIDLINQIKPHQIYAAGDLSDPHGTHRTCLSAIIQSMLALQAEEDWAKACEVWLYRGAWQEWPPEEIEMAVPLSPHDMGRKRNAIFKHESQKDRALFPGSDEREFWQRSEDRNHHTAQLYDQLGLAEYEGIEGFVRWDGITQY